MHPVRPARRDPAVKEAHEVVGLYGDPDTSWGIAVDLGVRDLVAGQAAERLAALCSSHEHLGAAPAVEVVGEADWASRRAALAAGGYGSEALIRVAVREDGRRLAVGAHHGAVDGLGLIAVASAALGQPLMAQARGIGDRGAPAGFARSSLARLREAMVDPPPRFDGSGEPGRDEDLSELTRPLVERGTAHLAVAAARVFGDRGHGGIPLLVIGASRRTGNLPQANRETAYLRLRVPVDAAAGTGEPGAGERPARTRLPGDLRPRGRPQDHPSAAPSARRHRPAEQPGAYRRARRVRRHVPRVQRTTSSRPRPGVHGGLDHPQPAHPSGRVQCGRARPAARRRGRPLLRLTACRSPVGARQ